MRRILAIVLLALLPVQLSWAAVATYCGHETQAGAGHFGHHAHQHDGNASADADAGAAGEKATGASDIDCGHCQGHATAMLNLPAGLPGTLSAALPTGSANEAAAAHAPPRPERPQWAPLA